MNIKHLRQQKADALAKARGISETAETEKRSLTDPERTEFDSIMSGIETLNADILRAEKLLDEERVAPGLAYMTVDAPNAAKQPWGSFGEQLGAIAKYEKNGHRNMDPRLMAALGANESVDAEGGFLVPAEFAAGILQRTYETGLVASRCFQMPMQSNRLVMNAVDEDSRADGSRWGGIQAYWIYEAAAYTATKPKFRQMQLVANKLTGLCYATEELLEDGPALETYISQAFPEEFAFKIDDAVLNGPGAGAPLGIQTSLAALVVAKTGGQSAATVSTQNILDMYSRLYSRSRANAVWFINQDVESQLWQLTIGSSAATQLIYAPPGVNGNGSPNGLLLGRPVIPIEQAATLGTQGDILLADMGQYLLAKKGGMRADSSIHVAFLTGEQAFRFMLRLDGQPMWKKPLTPKNGTATLSPFVTLQARS